MPNTLDPRLATDATGMRMADILFSSLVQRGPDLRVVGDAAKTWKLDKNGKDLEFNLHQNLQFTSGRPLECADIIFSFDFFRSDKSPFHSALEPIDNVSCFKNNKKFIVKLHNKSFSATLIESGLSVVRLLPSKEIRKHLAQNKNDHVSTKNKVGGLPNIPPEVLLDGTGPYKFVSQTPNEIQLEARADHPVHQPRLKNLIFKIVRDDVTRVQKLLKGELDIAVNEIPPLKVATFESKASQFEVFKYPGLSFTYLLLNLKKSSLKNKQTRFGLAQSIDRQAIIDHKMAGLANVADSILTPKNPFYSSGLNPIEFKPTATASDTTELVFKTSNNPATVQKAKVITQQLIKAGFKIKLQSFEWGTYYGDVKSGHYDIALMRWVNALDPDIYRIALHSKEIPPQGRNRGHYSNSKVDSLVEKGIGQAQFKKRFDTYKRVQELVHDDLPIIPLWYDKQVAIVNRSVKGFKPSLAGDFTPFFAVDKDD